MLELISSGRCGDFVGGAGHEHIVTDTPGGGPGWGYRGEQGPFLIWVAPSRFAKHALGYCLGLPSFIAQTGR
jgi:hypothetical protein